MDPLEPEAPARPGGPRVPPPRPAPPLTASERARALMGRLVPTGSGRGRAALGLAAGAVGVAGAAVAAWWLLHSPAPPVDAALPRATTTTAATTTAATAPGPAATGSSPAAGGSGAPAATTPPAAPATLVVQAAGAVARPGVYRVAAGARVVDVVEAAGGPTPDADPHQLALAATVADGARIYVPRRGEAAEDGRSIGIGSPGSPAVAGSPSAGPTAAAVVDLNTATVEELDALTGIGPATAQAIVEHRRLHGPFSSVDGLLAVRGIGPAKLEAVRDRVRV